jgi:NADPH:quinone reductase-like Zn-dependent oxidoreductase
MRAAWFEEFGAAGDVLQIGEIDTPEPGPGEVLVRLHAPRRSARAPACERYQSV